MHTRTTEVEDVTGEIAPIAAHMDAAWFAFDTDGGTETGGEGTGEEGTGKEGTGPDAATEKRKDKKQRIRKPNKLGIG